MAKSKRKNNNRIYLIVLVIVVVIIICCLFLLFLDIPWGGSSYDSTSNATISLLSSSGHGQVTVTRS